MNWIETFVNAHKDSETPKRYFYWSAVAVLSGVVKNNIWLDRFYYKLYPNVYVAILSAGSGLRKGVPLSRAKSILEEVGNTKIISGANTIEAVIQTLSNQTTLENGQVLREAQGILISDEFHNLLLKNPDALTLLTGLYNTHEHEKEWKKSLKSGVESLSRPCISLLIASNEKLFNDVISGKDIEGGFIARSFIIYESKRALRNSLTNKPTGMLSKAELSAYPKELTKLKGEFIWPDDSKKFYDKWYDKVCDLSESVKDRSGSLERIGDSVLKLSMLIALANKPELVLEKAYLEEAVEKSEECIGGIKQVSMAKGESGISGAVKIFLTRIAKISRRCKERGLNLAA